MTTSPPPAPDANGGGQPAQPAPGQYGQPAEPAPGQYGQPAPAQYGQPAQPAPGQYGQPAPGQYQGGQPAQGQYGQPAPGQYPGGQPPQGQYGAPGGQGADGLDPKVGGIVAYLTWIGGLIMLLTQKDRTVRFHGAQSIALTIVAVAIYIALWIIDFVIILTVGFSLSVFLSPLLAIGFFVLWIILVIKAYNREYFKLPVVGDLAEKFVK